MPAYLTSIGTAVPKNRLLQTVIVEFMIRASNATPDEARKLKALYRHTKIQTRHSVLSDYGQLQDFDFYTNSPDLEPFPSIAKRMQAYQTYALPLALEAIYNLTTDVSTFTHIITVSCTGMYAPGLDIELIKALKLANTIERTAINFMGCYGAFSGMKVAAAIVNADPTARVLLVCVELCTLHFQKRNVEDFVLSNALFADGAAAVVVEAKPTLNSLEISTFYCDLLPDGSQDMAWYVADFGFEMKLSSYIPKLIKNGITNLLKHAKQKIFLENVDFYAIHPGGRAILEVIEQELAMTPTDNKYAYEILSMYGNMSSATVLFVLQRLWQNLTEADQGKHIFSCAFGPGLTLESAIFKFV